MPDPVILVDRRTLVVEANPAARALLPALLQARPLSFALRSPEVLDGVEAVLRPLLENPAARAAMRGRPNPYGDGRAGVRVAQAVAWRLGLAGRPGDWAGGQEVFEGDEERDQARA